MARIKNTKTLVVIDLEATCWDKDELVHPVSEIIEIGVCPLNLQTLEIGQKHSIMVKPEHGKISKFCTDLTTITQEMVDTQGIPLKEALVKLYSLYNLREMVWASWGDYDRKQFERDTKAKGIPFNYFSHMNLKTILTAEYGWDRQYGMDELLEMFNLELIGTHHRGSDDAGNIARIYQQHLARFRNLLKLVPILNPKPIQ